MVLILPLALSLSSPLALLTPALPQGQVGGEWETHYRLDGPKFQDSHGYALASITDVDGDGVRDLLVGNFMAQRSSFIYDDRGAVDVYSGRTGAFIDTFWGPQSIGYMAMLGMSMAEVGDVDGDGISDYASGAPMETPNNIWAGGSTFIVSGATNKMIFRIDGYGTDDHQGWAVAGLGDVNGDGHADVASGSPMVSSGGLDYHAGEVVVHSGKDGVELWNYTGNATGDAVAFSLASAGDLSGDNVADLLVGVRGRNEVVILDGTDGSMLYRLPAASGTSMFGASVAGGHDMDLDGTPDFLVGATGGHGAVILYSGANYSQIRRWDGAGPDDMSFGHAVAFAGDTDGDKETDILVGAPKANRNGVVRCGASMLFSGRTGDKLGEWVGEAYEDYQGWAVAWLGDIDRDGLDEFVDAAIYQDSVGGVWSTGAVYARGLDPYLKVLPEEVSISHGGVVGFFADFPDSAAGAGYQLLMSKVGPGATSMGGIEIPLAQDLLLSNTSAGIYPRYFSRPMGTLNGQGQAHFAAIIQPGHLPASLAGRDLYAAVVTLGNGGYESTSACRQVRLEP